MRRDRIMECTVATVAGIGLAAVLTASLGVRSSGPPAPLRAEVSTAAEKPVIAPAEVPSKQRAVKPAPRRHHRRHTPVYTPPPPAPSPIVAQAQPPRVVAPRPRPVRIQPVSAPAPAPAPKPAPPKPPSRPKRTVSKGISFDDSG